jgi:hypothetical protein
MPLSPWRQRLEAERELLEQQDHLLAERDEAAAAAAAAQAAADARELAAAASDNARRGAFGGALGRRLQRTLRRRGIQAANALDCLLAMAAFCAAWTLHRIGSLKPMAKLVCRQFTHPHP